MLNGIHLVDFGNHRDTRLTFGRMTALIGQNGAGKTNLLRGIMEVGRFINGRQKDKFTTNLRAGTREWKMSAGWRGPLQRGREIYPGTWALNFSSIGKFTWLWRAEDSGRWVPNPAGAVELVPHLIGNHLWSPIDGSRTDAVINDKLIVQEVGQPTEKWDCKYFKTAGSYLQGPSYSEASPPVLSEDCRDLAWMIAYLKGDKDEYFDEILESMREVVPAFRKVRHRPVPVHRIHKKEIVIDQVSRTYDEAQKVMGQELRFDMASGKDLPASSISEGTLVTLAIITAAICEDIMVDNSTKTILLDDVESGLHPSAQRDLVRQLRRLQENRPDLQIIFSSHSPYIIDEMSPEDVWLFAPDKEGIAHCAKLSDHPDAKRALGVLTTGEFWSAEGEAWVLDPSKRATAEPATATK